MAHFAELDENNQVLRVISVNNEDILDKNKNESESIGIDFCKKLFNGGIWLQTSINGNLRGRFAEPGMFYFPDYDVFSKTIPPGPWVKYDKDKEWYVDFPMNINTGELFTDDELRWIFYYIRNTKSYRICPAIPKDLSDEFLSKACTSTDFMYPTFEGLMYGSNRTQEIAEIKIEGEKIIIPFIHTLKKDIDITPVATILEIRWEGLNWDIAADSLNAHPQTASRTIQELFRLIIEWAYAHTEFGNNELAAVGCHKILRVLQMPLEVRNELLNEIEPQAVESYIRGMYPFKNTSFEILEDPVSPPLFTDWYESIQSKYPALKRDQTLHVDIDNVPENYPM